MTGVGGATGGTVELANSTITFTPTANYHGPASFTYTITDSAGGTAMATVSLTVTPINDAPVATNDSYTTNEDTPLTINGPGVLGNDSDPVESSPLTAHIVTGPSHGTLTLNGDGSFTYIPNANSNGPDSFTYRASDGTSMSNIATVTIGVTAVNDAPAANDDAYTTNEDTPLTITGPGVLANDNDTENSSLSAVLVNGPGHGSLSLNADGSFTYTPTANYSGTDTFTYRALDGTTTGNIATVTITITAVNDAPVATNDSYTANEDTPLTITGPGVLANDTDPAENSALTALIVTGPSHGTLTLNADGSFTYIPNANSNGPDSFTYRASDGTSFSNIATVTIGVTAVNDAPVANDDSYTVTEDGSLGASAASGVLSNDADVENSSLTAVLVNGPGHGALSLNADGSFTYTPHANYAGTDTFTYRASDGTTTGNIATVTITVTGVNDAPVAVNNSYTTDEDVALQGNVLTNDTDADGNPLTAHLVGGPGHGALTLNADGSFTYTPANNYNGPDSFTYRVNDGTTFGNTATVSITVTAVNDAPVANPDTFTASQLNVLQLNRSVPSSPVRNVGINDTDVEGNPLTAYELVSGPSNASSFTFNTSTGAFTYTSIVLSGLLTGIQDTFTYRVFDGTSWSAATTVTINIPLLL